ncbi:transferrin-binding protein-like solute binding protein [Cognatiyoonia sp. IB215182]|uniref:transferrin-binding protein-like solute binding protein n=1 Tax=Cognatiyoonia sp. IB215182 TaxID=3097353 RepID=UPI002A0EDDB9|nr:transferrin-binding protein-like solute binding protein [Cognatiyoonia sp. IB215182]MDX8353130.1 transferrin-binding protein-like solute binding protein [Cognatiyoonia sp. IB215182]
MQFFKKIGTIAVIGLSFAACSSGDGGDDLPERDLGLFFGSTDPQQARNGVDYADATTELSDLEGQTFTVRVVRVTEDEETGEVRQETTDEIVNFQDEENLTITLDVATLNIVDGEAPADDGDVFTLRRREGSSVQGFVLEKRDPDAITINIGTSSFLIGAETNPDQIDALTGSVTYTAPLQINPVVGNRNSLRGDVTLEANFASSTVSGDVTLAQVGTGVEVGLDLAPAAITGNGFAGDLTIGTCSEASCTSDSEIGGVFFGNNGAEIGGLINLDVTISDADGTTTDLIGTDAFVATEEVLCCE